MLLGYGDVAPQVLVDTELYYYVEQDEQVSPENTQQAPKEVQSASEEAQSTTGVSDEELSLLF